MRFLYLLIGIIVVVSYSCGVETSGKTREPVEQGKKVKVVRAMEGRVPEVVPVSGTLAAEEEVQLSMKVQGRIQQIFVDLGSSVQKGQALVKLEPTDFELRVQQAQAAYQQARVRLGLSPDTQDTEQNVDPEQTGVVRQAKAVLEEARLTRDRMDSLFKEGLASKSQLDDAIAAYQVADARYQDALEEVRTRQALLIQRRAELDLATKQLSDSNMRSPMDGKIQVRQVSPGQFVAVGDPVLTLVRVDPLRLKLAVPEREAGRIRTGQEVRVHVEGDSNTYTGKLARVSPGISAGSRTLMVEAEIRNQQGFLRPGSFARAEIVIQAEQPAILIPASSVVTFAGITKVISVENNQAVEKRITTGRRHDQSIEVVEGVSAGETIVLEPGNLVQGDKVTPLW